MHTFVYIIHFDDQATALRCDSSLSTIMFFTLSLETSFHVSLTFVLYMLHPDLKLPRFKKGQSQPVPNLKPWACHRYTTAWPRPKTLRFRSHNAKLGCSMQVSLSRFQCNGFHIQRFQGLGKAVVTPRYAHAFKSGQVAITCFKTGQRFKLKCNIYTGVHFQWGTAPVPGIKEAAAPQPSPGSYASGFYLHTTEKSHDHSQSDFGLPYDVVLIVSSDMKAAKITL